VFHARFMISQFAYGVVPGR